MDLAHDLLDPVVGLGSDIGVGRLGDHQWHHRPVDLVLVDEVLHEVEDGGSRLVLRTALPDLACHSPRAFPSPAEPLFSPQ
ncbi:hypothetical protein ACVWXU_006520 [Streptomyces sp. TE33382]